MNYERDKPGTRLDFRGMNLVLPVDRMPPGKYPFAQNVRRYVQGGIIGRATQDSSVMSLPTAVHSIRRLNDLTPAGPDLGFVIIAGAADSLYSNGSRVDSGLSGNPVSLLPFRPNTSVQPWMYVGDSLKMDKIRSDGLCYKMGIKEPQIPPVVNSIPASDTISTLGDITVYYYNNPQAAHNAPLANNYIWHHPSDRGATNLVETIADANGSNTGNSLLFDDGLNVGGANPVAWSQYQTYIGTVNVNGTAVTWDSGDQFGGLTNGSKIIINGVSYTITGTPTNTSLSITSSAGNQTSANYSAAIISGTMALFAPQMESEGYQDFNCSILGTFYVPAPGIYTFSVVCKDDFMWGIGNAPNGSATWGAPSGAETLSTFRQSKTTINAYPLIPRVKESSGEDTFTSTANVDITFSQAGNYPFEIDWDYWFHKPRGLTVKVNGQNIPPIPPSAITNSQYRYVYRSSATGAVSNPSPESPQSPLSVLSNLVEAFFSTDLQVDKIDIYRLDAGVTNFTYVGTIQNNEASTVTTQAVSVTGSPQTIDVQSTVGLFIGLFVSVDAAGSQEVVQISAVGFQESVIANITSVSASSGGDVPGVYLVNTTAGFNVGDVVNITGVASAAGTPPNFFNGTLVIRAINPGVSISAGAFLVPFLPLKPPITYSGTGGTMADQSNAQPSITAVFSKTHLSGVAVVSIGAQLSDTLLDSDIADNPILDFDNFEPFPSIDLPRKGIVNVYGIDSGNSPGVVSWVSGDEFNTRWLPGTLIKIGTVEYSLNTRPASNFALTASNVDVVDGVQTVVTPPIGLGLIYEIPEPILAAQPLPYIWGPTDNVAFAYGVGDPLRPGTLYWCKGNNLDSAPDTNQQDITSPSEPLMNGCMVGGFGMVFSTERAWIIWPNYFNALATVQGTAGSVWTLQESISTRGLYIPRALAVDGFGNVYFRAKDGIYKSPGGTGATSITDDDLYPLFPHEGKLPSSVTIAGKTIFPPDDTQPQLQKMSCATGYLYYDYVDVNGNPRTLVYDILAQGWVWDVYQRPVTVHALEEGPNVNQTLVGCADGTVRPLTAFGDEAINASVAMPSYDAGDTRADKHWGDIYTEIKE